jgi:hypothetical protein
MIERRAQEFRAIAQTAGNEWCSCITRQRPAILRRPIVNRNVRGFLLPFGSILTQLPMAVAKASSEEQQSGSLSCENARRLEASSPPSVVKL